MQSCVGGICVKIWRGADLDGPPISPLGIWTARHVQTQRSPGNISNDEGPEIREDEPKKTGLLHPVDIGFDPGVRDHSRNTVNEHLETAKPKVPYVINSLNAIKTIEIFTHVKLCIADAIHNFT